MPTQKCSASVSVLVVSTYIRKCLFLVICVTELRTLFNSIRPKSLLRATSLETKRTVAVRNLRIFNDNAILGNCSVYTSALSPVVQLFYLSTKSFKEICSDISYRQAKRTVQEREHQVRFSTLSWTVSDRSDGLCMLFQCGANVLYSLPQLD